MQIIQQYPPNIAKIKEKFNLAGKQPVFAYGDRIYNPFANNLPDHIIEHEKTHLKQQEGMTIEEWWNKYLEDPEFRLNQEIEAYRVQYKYLEENANRADRRLWLKRMVKDVSGAMYGNMVSAKRAEELITFNQ